MSQYNPFEQFEIMLIQKVNLLGYDISITNLTFVILTTTLLLVFINYVFDKSYNYIPHNWQVVMESVYLFVFSIVAEQSGSKGVKFFPHLLTIFFLILFFNLSGLVPFSFTASSHVVITFGLALSYFLAWVIVGIKELGPNFVYVFCPKNMPLWLLPLLICVEFLSFFLRPISLGVRLFANMLAGHILLHILAGACVYLLTKFIILSIPAFVIVGAIGFLELFIGFLQSYIFTILLAIYLKDSLYSH